MTSDYVSYVLGLQGWERIQNENTPGTAGPGARRAHGSWQPSCSRSCSPARASTTCHDKIDGWDAGIEKHVGGTLLLVPSSHFKITEHHRHNLYR